jgi:hypothetical protein
MKQTYFLPTILIFFLTGCQTTPTPYRISINDEVSIHGSGGNPEVQLNKCLNKKEEERNICIDHFYPEDIDIGIYPPDGTRIKLAGRASSIERRELIIHSQQRVILSIDTTNVSLPLTSNISPIQQLQHNHNLAIIIETKNIEERVTLKDSEGKVVLDYTIIKK